MRSSGEVADCNQLKIPASSCLFNLREKKLSTWHKVTDSEEDDASLNINGYFKVKLKNYLL